MNSTERTDVAEYTDGAERMEHVRGADYLDGGTSKYTFYLVPYAFEHLIAEVLMNAF